MTNSKHPQVSINNIIECEAWAIYTNSDLVEGRGVEYIKHYCLLKETAKRLAKGNYVQGTDCPIQKVKLMYNTKTNEYYVFLPIQIVKPDKKEMENSKLQMFVSWCNFR